MTTTPTVQQCDRIRASGFAHTPAAAADYLGGAKDDTREVKIVAAHREAATAPLIELLREAREGLREIAGQMRPDEMDKITRDNADFDDGYDACVAKARSALAKIDNALWAIIEQEGER